ncbi:hypothetical protein CEXT_46451 [Caerostris extrusa]|uniref:Uncharacterized protein n=1 Tax=Caerostris extrusa TaxID=172846 RepID=A0AAV4MPI7_CAEEX|nr:hypothetical protein CEXT_46451 [Caerostris extrusa]
MRCVEAKIPTPAAQRKWAEGNDNEKEEWKKRKWRGNIRKAFGSGSRKLEREFLALFNISRKGWIDTAVPHDIPIGRCKKNERGIFVGTQNGVNSNQKKPLPNRSMRL